MRAIAMSLEGVEENVGKGAKEGNEEEEMLKKALAMSLEEEEVHEEEEKKEREVVKKEVSSAKGEVVKRVTFKSKRNLVESYFFADATTAGATASEATSPICGLIGCGVKVGKGGLCTGCRSVNYCSKEHQRRDWPSHKIKCRALKKSKLLFAMQS